MWFYSMLNCTQLCETRKGGFDCQRFEHPAGWLFSSNIPLRIEDSKSAWLVKNFELPALVLAC